MNLVYTSAQTRQAITLICGKNRRNRQPEGEWTVGWGDPAMRFVLRDSALSVSAPHGKSFTAGGRVYGHVIDPRTGVPAGDSVSAVVTGPCSLECDALSTALLVLGAGWLPALRERFPGYDGAVV